jgi:hypothetical protein
LQAHDECPDREPVQKNAKLHVHGTSSLQ